MKWVKIVLLLTVAGLVVYTAKDPQGGAGAVRGIIGLIVGALSLIGDLVVALVGQH
jgi:membrane-bound ClpP family serine protease